MDLPADPVTDALLDFTCPRCEQHVSEPFYGPCSECRAQLQLAGGEQTELTQERFEPKMNVVPNQVATKD